MFFNKAILIIQQIFTNIFQALFLCVHTPLPSGDKFYKEK